MFFISLHTYNKFGRVTENEKEKVACIADFQISFQATRSSAEAWVKATKKLGAEGGAYLAGLFHVFVDTM